MQELNPGARFGWRDLLRPGCLVALAGLVLMAVNLFSAFWSQHRVDLNTNPELVASGGTIKAMVWLVVGVGLVLLGALLSYLEYSRR